MTTHALHTFGKINELPEEFSQQPSTAPGGPSCEFSSRGSSSGAIRRGRRDLSQGRVDQLLVFGMGTHPTFNDGNPNPYNWIYINPYGIGLMSLSPIIWKYRELIDPIAHLVGN